MKLYRYRPFNDYTKEELLHGYCWYSDPEGFNDPFDCALARSPIMRQKNLLALKVLCLTQKCDSPLMWGHYADSHKGICIEYTIDEPNKARPVEYKTKDEINTHLSYFPSDYCEVMRLERDDSSNFHSKAEDGFFIKHIDWHYENEYRIIVKDSPNKQPNPGIVSAVYVGARMEFEDKHILKTILDNSVDLHQMVIDRGAYDLSHRKLDPQIDFQSYPY
ncbi:conserved hypothetical protein [Vibrio jasicida]|uniref:DUF2971 domain-containing protein n=1 Tax=Vibrio jasicida TaxID=766224 RepID=UPI002894576D|nr:conserved hypothetical protein [Vibrio jasicida]